MWVSPQLRKSTSSQVSIINRVDETLTTHDNGAVVNNYIRGGCRYAGRNLFWRKECSRGRVTDIHNPHDGTDNGDSSQEGDGYDKPISSQDPTSGSPAMAVGREDTERLLA